MPDYSKSKIYTIRSLSRPDLIYVGATTLKLNKRFANHNNEKKPCTSRKVLDIGDAYIELYELFPCSTKEELNKREGELIRLIDCVNKIITNRTKKEYYEENKVKLLQQSADWRKEHKDEVREKGKVYEKEHKDQIKEYRQTYYERNKDIINEKAKENRKNKERIKCECGSEIKDHFDVHLESKKHKKYLLNNSNTILTNEDIRTH